MPPSPIAVENRIHYLDNLRALAMLLGIFLHAGLAYANPAQAIWLATDPTSSITVDAVLWFIHLFRMSLFFLISGFLGHMVLQRRGTLAFLQGRLLRLGLPLVLCYPFLLASMTFIIMFALSYVDNPQGLIGLIAESMRHSTSEAESVRPGTMHLWFLYYLLAFSLIATGLSKLPPFSLRGFQRGRWLCVSCPLILVPAVIAAGVPLPAPESFIPAWWPFLFYGSFFWAGWKLHSHPQLLERLDCQLLPLTVVSIIGYVIYYQCMPELSLAVLTNSSSPQPFWERVTAVVLTAYLSVSLTLIALILGGRFLTQQYKALRLIADSSYWMYLIHLPLVLFLQTLLTPLTWPLWLKLATTVAGTFLPCFASYLVFVRYTPIGWLLHGKREFP